MDNTNTITPNVELRAMRMEHERVFGVSTPKLYGQYLQNAGRKNKKHGKRK